MRSSMNREAAQAFINSVISFLEVSQQLQSDISSMDGLDEGLKYRLMNFIADLRVVVNGLCSDFLRSSGYFFK